MSPPWEAPDRDEVLRRLWAEGCKCRDIAARMGTTHNAVIGRVHRLGLVGRASPIRRTPGVSPPAPKPARAPARTLPSLAATGPATAPLATPLVWAAPRPPAVPRARRAAQCCWPIGDPGTPGFRFCEVVVTSSHVYCAEHAAIAYVRAGDRREAAT